MTGMLRPPGAIGPEFLDYLQRVDPPPHPLDVGAPAVSIHPEHRAALGITAIARDPRRASAAAPDREPRPESLALVAGLAADGRPLTAAAGDTTGAFEFVLGTSGDGGPDLALADGLLRSLFASAYPHVDAGTLADTAPMPFARSGVVLGLPSVARPTPDDTANGLDRVVRAMAGQRWRVVIVAAPLSRGDLSSIRTQVIDEMRASTAARFDANTPSPLADHYGELLKSMLEELTDALSVGGWRTGVYLLSDEASFPALASAWQGVFSSGKPSVEAIQVVETPAAQSLAARWALADEQGEDGPGRYQRPFEWQTVMSSARLAAMIDLPSIEVPGFAVREVSRFDAVPPAVPPDSAVALGTVIRGGIGGAAAGTRGLGPSGGQTYAVSAQSLTKHAFVSGVTGSGKTNSIFVLLDSLTARGAPFLVIEPTKREYRALLAHPSIGRDLRVYTVGDERVAPLRLNPFEVVPGASVAAHVDLLRAAFDASFGMWSPLPQVLEQALHAVYADRGWDLRDGTNERVSTAAERADSFPTLTDLVAKVEELAPQLGYDEKVTSDIGAALVTRLKSLAIGAKGAMFDAAHATPIDQLLSAPAVLELEPLADDDDKAFFIGLLLIRIVEQRRLDGRSDGLRHLLVVEEAHRLLANLPQASSPEAGNPRGKAVDAFTTMLAEIRAYGQGVAIVDQVPTRLAPDVIKNTALKLVHRIVARDDREAVGSSMAMDDAQIVALGTLTRGQAAAFSEGDDHPVLVAVPAAATHDSASPSDDAVRTAMASRAGLSDWRPRDFCAQTCATPAACSAGRQLALEPTVRAAISRLVLSVQEDTGAANRLWPDLVATVRARRPARMPDADALAAVVGHGSDALAARRGAQSGWSYGDTRRYADAIRATLLPLARGGAGGDARAFADVAKSLHRRDYEPFSACARVCNQARVCLYRWPVADLVATRRFAERWAGVDREDDADESHRRTATWLASQEAAFELIQFPDEADTDGTTGSTAGGTADRDAIAAAARRTALCYAQQMLEADATKSPRARRFAIEAILAEAGLTQE